MADAEGQSKEETKGGSPKPDQDVAPPLISKRKSHLPTLSTHSPPTYKFIIMIMGRFRALHVVNLVIRSDYAV